MIRNFRGARYTTVMSSDLVRDGMGLELHDQRQGRVVAEVFFSDKDGSLTLSTFECGVPLELISEQERTCCRNEITEPDGEDELPYRARSARVLLFNRCNFGVGSGGSGTHFSR